MNDIEKIEKVKKDLRFGAEERCLKTDDCEKCEYYNPGGNCFTPVHVMRDALSVIESQQAEIERLQNLLSDDQPCPPPPKPEGK